MTIRELSSVEFRETFMAPMRRLESEESFRPVSLRDYVLASISAHKLSVTLKDIEVHHCYVSADGAYSHALLWYGVPNVYLVVVVAHPADEVFGHRILDLNAEYGLLGSEGSA